MSVDGDGYSRNAPSELNSISTFVLSSDHITAQWNSYSSDSSKYFCQENVGDLYYSTYMETQKDITLSTNLICYPPLLLEE